MAAENSIPVSGSRKMLILPLPAEVGGLPPGAGGDARPARRRRLLQRAARPVVHRHLPAGDGVTGPGRVGRPRPLTMGGTGSRPPAARP